MRIITSLTPQKSRDRINLFLDGAYAFSLSRELVLQKNLKIGTQLDEKSVRELLYEGVYQRLFDLACTFLSYRPRSTKEVRDYLVKKIGKCRVGKEFLPFIQGNQPAWVSSLTLKVIKKLEDCGYLNDAEFAAWWVRARQNTAKPKGARLIKQELWAKGVPDEIITQALGNTTASEHALALKAAQKILYKYKDLPSYEFRRKMGAYLQRRGFGWEIINQLISELAD